MESETISALEQEIRELKAKLKEREQSLPVHSARAHQFQQLEELEEEIAEKESRLKYLKKKDSGRLNSLGAVDF